MLKRAFTVMAVAAALVFGASTLFSEVSAARRCPAPGCPVISCPPCSILICDPGHCRMHCQLDPNCEP